MSDKFGFYGTGLCMREYYEDSGNVRGPGDRGMFSNLPGSPVLTTANAVGPSTAQGAVYDAEAFWKQAAINACTELERAREEGRQEERAKIDAESPTSSALADAQAKLNVIREQINQAEMAYAKNLRVCAPGGVVAVDWATACALPPVPLRVDHISKLRSTFGLKEGEAFPSFGAWEMDYDFLTDSLVLKKTKPLFSRQEIEDGRVTPEETQRRAAAILNRDTDPERQRQESIAAEWMRRRA